MDLSTIRYSIAIIIALAIAGLICIVVSVTKTGNINYGFSLAGYISILICILFIIYSYIRTTNRNTVMLFFNISPFIVIFFTIIMIITTITKYGEHIINNTASLEYYKNSASDFFTLLIIVILYLYGMNTNDKDENIYYPMFKDDDIPYAMIFFAIWFFAYGIIMNDILKYYSTDDQTSEPLPE